MQRAKASEAYIMVQIELYRFQHPNVQECINSFVKYISYYPSWYQNVFLYLKSQADKK